MSRSCESCGMPLVHKEDFAGGDSSSVCCVHCVGTDGRVKSCEEIFEGGVRFFMAQLGLDRSLAERATRKNMKMQPYWQGKDLAPLRGEVSSDAEFLEVLRKLT